MISAILKLLGFKNGWEDFEKEVEKEKFKNTLNWFKTNLSIDKYDKDNKNLIFAKAFKDHPLYAKPRLTIESEKPREKLKGAIKKFRKQIAEAKKVLK